MNDIDKKLEELKKEYEKNPTETLNTINETILNLKNDNKKSESLFELKEVKKVPYIIGIYAVIILLIGIVNLMYEGGNILNYYFGAIFLLAGLFIGLFVPMFGLIFLFSHGGAGFVVMNMNVISSVWKARVSNTNLPDVKLVILFSLLLLVAGVILTILYNLNKKFKDKNSNLILILALILSSILIIQLTPIIYNINI